MTSSSPLTGENIVIFSSDDWASGLKTSKYHVARQLARHKRVLFVNSIGLRAPTASGRDIGRIFKKLAGFFKGTTKVPEGLHVYTPIAIPFRRGSRLVKMLNAIVLRVTLRWLKWRLSLSDPIVFCFIPTFNEVVGSLGEKAIIYYCIDDLRGYGGVDIDWFNREEERLLSRANCVISSASELNDAFLERGHKAHYVSHGVDWPLFRKAIEEELPEPEDLRGIPHPRLGFYGFLSDEWVDYPLLKRMASERPDWHIILIGRPSAGMDMDALVPEPNIHVLGLKPFESLPAYTRHFDVGLIPFNLNQLTLHCNPLKLLEYLSGGIPVVTTDIPVVRQYGDAVRVATSQEEFIALCGEAMEAGDAASREKRSRAVEEYSWERRIETISDIVRQYLTSTP